MLEKPDWNSFLRWVDCLRQRGEAALTQKSPSKIEIALSLRASQRIILGNFRGERFIGVQSGDASGISSASWASYSFQAFASDRGPFGQSCVALISDYGMGGDGQCVLILPASPLSIARSGIPWGGDLDIRLVEVSGTGEIARIAAKSLQRVVTGGGSGLRQTPQPASMGFEEAGDWRAKKGTGNRRLAG